MPVYTFEEIEERLRQCIDKCKWEAELRLKFADRPHEYMIIVYDDLCSFQRCGAGERERNYAALEELYRAEQMDGVILERDWGGICAFECMEFDILGLW